MTRETQLDDLLLKWEAGRQEGNSLSPEEACAGCPELVEKLRDRIKALKAMDPVLEMTPNTENSTGMNHVQAPNFPNSHPTKSHEGGPSQPWPRLIPKTVGDYDILEEIAVGGMGVVFKARHRSRDAEVVALKMMRTDGDTSPQRAQRFHREILAVARLHHPNIVPILDVGWHEGIPFYTMPFRTGGNLGKLRGQPGSDTKTLVALMEKIARGVQHAHEQEVLHRDLKPGNILLDEQGEPAVTDFGLAKLHDTDIELTQTGMVMGTWPYLSPEQADGRTRDLGPATDVWALGVILYELLTGQKPFPGKGNNEIREKILRAKPTPLRKLRPEIPWELEAIVNRCLQKKPARRYFSAGTFADDLRGWQDGERPRPHRRNVLFLLALLGLVAIGLATLRNQPNPPNEKNPTPLVLIGENEPPQNFGWAIGQKDAVILTGQPGLTFSVQSKKISLLELLSKPPWPQYRFEAEVQHWDSEDGIAGIYMGRRSYQSETGTYHRFCALTFAEVGVGTKQRSLVARRVQEMSEGFGDGIRAPGIRGVFSKPSNLAGVKSWRKLALEVRNEGVTAFWGREQFALFPGPKLQEAFERLFKDLPPAGGKYYPNGSLGLIIQNGKASFQNVVLRLIP